MLKAVFLCCVNSLIVAVCLAFPGCVTPIAPIAHKSVQSPPEKWPSSLPLLFAKKSPSNNARKHKRRLPSLSASLNNANMSALLASRRSLLRTFLPASLISTAALTRNASPANAGLVQFPCKNTLFNTYHFMRAGQSLLEELDIISSNPLFLTNRENALSSQGIDQVAAACKDMIARDINPSMVKYSLAANSMDTANIVANEMKIGRNMLVPEYTWMDARGVGKWDMHRLSTTEHAIWALDDAEAGPEGRGGRPPPNDDGTPNETLYEQVVRLRQLISLLETQCAGDTILLIFPDGTGPALLTALIAGIPLSRVHEMNYSPGEIRYDVNMKSALQLLPSQPLPGYIDAISRGRDQLKAFAKNPEQLLNMKEEIEQLERLAILAEKEVLNAAKREEELSDRKAAAARHSRWEQERQAGVFGNKVGHLPDFFSVLTLGLVGYMALWQDPLKKATGASDRESGEIGTKADAILKWNDLDSSLELAKMETLVANAPFDVPELNEAVHSEQPDDTVTQNDHWNEMERIEHAEHAMEKYLNQGDGADEWLKVMSGIMTENDSD